MYTYVPGLYCTPRALCLRFSQAFLTGTIQHTDKTAVFARLRAKQKLCTCIYLCVTYVHQQYGSASFSLSCVCDAHRPTAGLYLATSHNTRMYVSSEIYMKFFVYILTPTPVLSVVFSPSQHANSFALKLGCTGRVLNAYLDVRYG